MEKQNTHTMLLRAQLQWYYDRDRRRIRLLRQGVGPIASNRTRIGRRRNSLKISAHDLVKVYKDRRVVNGVSLEVSDGEIVGLLGPNGAGKTTTFYMIVGLVN